jgi:hypothetical protein
VNTTLTMLVTFNPSCRCHLPQTRRHNDITPPNTPQSHQRRRRRLQRDTRESQDGSPRRRRIPVRNHDEMYPACAHWRNQVRAPSANVGGISWRGKIGPNHLRHLHPRTDHKHKHKQTCGKRGAVCANGCRWYVIIFK